MCVCPSWQFLHSLHRRCRRAARLSRSAHLTAVRPSISRLTRGLAFRSRRSIFQPASNRRLGSRLPSGAMSTNRRPARGCVVAAGHGGALCRARRAVTRRFSDLRLVAASWPGRFGVRRRLARLRLRAQRFRDRHAAGPAGRRRCSGTTTASGRGLIRRWRSWTQGSASVSSISRAPAWCSGARARARTPKRASTARDQADGAKVVWVLIAINLAGSHVGLTRATPSEI